MLFLVGLELEPRRLWAMRRAVFGWGSLQLFGSTLLLMPLLMLGFGWAWAPALVAGLALGMSSTAIGLGVMADDWAAGIYANLALHGILAFAPSVWFPI